jgi:hypothetical protein
MEACVHACVSPCGIYGGQSGSGIDFPPSALVFPVTVIQPWLCILIYQMGMNNRLAGGSGSKTTNDNNIGPGLYSALLSY